MSLVKAACAVLLLMLVCSCAGEKADSHIKPGSVGLVLAEYPMEPGKLVLKLVNRSTETIVINGIFHSGSFQSAVRYEVDGPVTGPEEDEHVARSAIIRNPEEHRIVLAPEGMYGLLLDKATFASLNGLVPGECYKIRATYESAEPGYSRGLWQSNLLSMCY